MRPGAFVAAVMAVMGCGDDPSLRVIVEHPEGFTVAETIVSVYESDAFSCEKVEFGDLGADELAAALVDEDRISAVDGVSEGLAGISRVERKIIVARGFDADGVFVTAGCNHHDEIAGDDKVVVKASPTASISVFGSEDLDDPNGLTVTVVDAHGNSIDERRVAWRVFGPDGTTPYMTENIDMPVANDAQWVPIEPTCSNRNGIVELHPMPPSLIGGFATQVRASWSTEPPRTFTSFTDVKSFENVVTIAPPAVESRRWCAPRLKNGTFGLACLDNRTGPLVRDFQVNVDAGTVQLVERDQQTFPPLLPTEDVLSLYSLERRDAQGTLVARDVYALTTKARVFDVFAPTVPSNPSATPRLAANERALDLLVMPACGADPQRVMIHHLQTNGTAITHHLKTMVPEGGALASYFSQVNLSNQPLQLNQAGCMTELVPNQPTEQLRQVAVIDLGRTSSMSMERQDTQAWFPCNAAGGSCFVRLPVARAAVGFVPPGKEKTHRMVGAFFDASGTVLSEWVLQPNDEGKDRLVELGRITAAAFPQHLVVGNFDGDSEPDLLWDIANNNQNVSNFQISYFRKVFDERLTALSGAVQDTIVVDAFAADVDGDGHDDFVFTFQDKEASRRGVTVIPFGVPPKPHVPKMEVKCQPKNAEMQP